VEAYDALGRRVAVLHDGLLAAGDHELRWTGRDESGAVLPSGVYLVRARQGEHTATRRLTVTR
jgi:flagellar hook assembly protein FlgD